MSAGQIAWRDMSIALTASERSCAAQAPSSSEAGEGVRLLVGRRRGPTSDLSHGAHHRGAQKGLPVGPRIVVIISGPPTIIISGGSANSASSTHQLVRAARTTKPVSPAAHARPPTMNGDEFRGGYGEFVASTLTGSGFGLDSLFDMVIPPIVRLLLSFH